MASVSIKVLGISGSPIKGGNCDIVVQEALRAAAELGGVETDFITLADKNVALCQDCRWCMENRSPCKIKDDAHVILDQIIESDGIILGAPTWSRNAAPPIPILFSRTRYYHFFTDGFRNKVVGCLTVGFLGIGLELTLDTLKNCLGLNAIPVTTGWALTSTVVFGQRAKFLEHGVLDDIAGMRRVRNVGIRVAEVARMIKYATQAGIVLPEQYRMTFTGAHVGPTVKKVFDDDSDVMIPGTQ